MDNTTTYPPINEARPAPAYEVGSKVTYLCGNTYRTGIVTEKHADIKNGRPGFVMDDGSRFGVWGYDYQLTMVWS